MSVIVTGMEMPVRCFECPIIDATDGLWCSAADMDLRKEHGINLSRPDWCPLRPLPEKHGRLIDAQYFDEMHFVDGLREGDKLYVPFIEVSEIIFKAPTIVEAEG